MRISAGKEQKDAILDRFGTEPWPYEWSEQDVSTQIQNLIGCGEFVKTPIQYSESKFVNTLDGEVY
jgi:hypothetical protein